MIKERCSICGCNYYAKEGSTLLKDKECWRCWKREKTKDRPRGNPNEGKR